MSQEDDKILMDHMKETVPLQAWAVARQLEAAYELMRTRPGNDEFKLRHVLAIAWQAGVKHEQKTKRHIKDHDLRDISKDLDSISDKIRDMVRKEDT